MKRIADVLLILSISLTFLLVSIETNAYNKNYYLNSYKKYNIETESGKTMSELSIITDDLIQYLKGKGDDKILEPWFNNREILHMRDVKQLFNYGRIVKYAAGTLTLMIFGYYGYRSRLMDLGKVLYRGIFLNYVLLACIVLLAVSDFNRYFTVFHHIFFTNDLWILDPKTDLMIRMLPEQFFSGLALRIGLYFFVYLSIIQIAGYYYTMKGRVK